MEKIRQVDITIIEDHLSRQGSGVSIQDMPGSPKEYKGFEVLLEHEDIQKLVLYWQLQDFTKDKSGRLDHVLVTASTIPRVKSFMDGDRSKGLPPANLKTLPNSEPTIVTDDLGSSFLCLIDGNHRAVAQHLSGHGFEGIPAFVCTHPKIREWACTYTQVIVS